MITTENRALAAMRAIASTVDDAPPLTLTAAAPRPSRVARRWRGWMVPLTAAAAMLAVGIALVAVRDIPNGHVAPPAAPAASFAVPTYYVALTGTNPGGTKAKVVVRDTVTGRRLFAAPGKFVVVAAAADDRTFVAGAQGLPSTDPGPAIWYLLRVTAGPAAHVTMRRLPVPQPEPDSFISAVALSPDGTKLATMGFLPGARKGQLRPVVLRVYSVTTGALLRQWSTPRSAQFPQFSSLWWARDGQLAFDNVAITMRRGHVQRTISVRMLAVTSPEHDLLAVSRLAWSVEPPNSVEPTARTPFGCVLGNVMVAADGKMVLCPAAGVFRVPKLHVSTLCPAIPPWNTEGFLGYSTATGKLVRTLYAHDSNCVPSRYEPVGVLWASSDGSTVIGDFTFSQSTYHSPSIIAFGVFSAGKFKGLPFPPTADAGTIAF